MNDFDFALKSTKLCHNYMVPVDSKFHEIQASHLFSSAIYNSDY